VLSGPAFSEAVNPEVIWTLRAEADLLREFSRLEESREGSGEEFLDMVDSASRLLRMNPEMAPRYSDRYRRLLLRDRRLGLFYCHDSRGIVVPAICDLRQDREAILRHLSH
jgi:plasmid stabilization system protein ParE